MPWLKYEFILKLLLACVQFSQAHNVITQSINRYHPVHFVKVSFAAEVPQSVLLLETERSVCWPSFHWRDVRYALGTSLALVRHSTGLSE